MNIVSSVSIPLLSLSEVLRGELAHGEVCSRADCVQVGQGGRDSVMGGGGGGGEGEGGVLCGATGVNTAGLELSFLCGGTKKEAIYMNVICKHNHLSMRESMYFQMRQNCQMGDRIARWEDRIARWEDRIVRWGDEIARWEDRIYHSMCVCAHTCTAASDGGSPTQAMGVVCWAGNPPCLPPLSPYSQPAGRTPWNTHTHTHTHLPIHT